MDRTISCGDSADSRRNWSGTPTRWLAAGQKTFRTSGSRAHFVQLSDKSRRVRRLRLIIAALQDAN
jgi:hypothetical protein